MKMKMKIASDHGNSTHKIAFTEEEILFQPSVYSKILKLPKGLFDINPQDILKNIHNKLLVSITSPAVENGTPTTCYVGLSAFESGKYVHSMEIGVRGQKKDSEIPIISTLAHCAAYVVEKTYQKTQDLDKITKKVIISNIEMATALPVAQYTKENNLIFRNKFLGKHQVTVYLGPVNISVELIFDYVKVLPEAVPTIFYLQSKKNVGCIGLDPNHYDFSNKNILHVAIGEGTTEYPLTNHINFNPEFIDGSNNGVGVATEEILPEYKTERTLNNLSRQELSLKLQDKNDLFHSYAMELMQDPLFNQAEEIKDNIKKQLSRAKNNVDYVLVYGGGSILMQPFLENALKNDPAMKSDVNPNGIELIYITGEKTTCLEALGLYTFAQTEKFADLAKKFKDKD